MTLSNLFAIQDGEAVARHLRVVAGLFMLLFFFAGEDNQVAVQASFLIGGSMLLLASELLPGMLSEVQRRRQAIARGARAPGPINWPERPSSRGSSRGGRPVAPHRNRSRSRPRTHPGAAGTVARHS